jgi:hypothetical protein
MEHTIRELNPKDHDWISERATEGQGICEHYGVTPASQISPKTLDMVFHLWWNDKGSDRVSKETIVNCLGCLFGELLCVKFGSIWKIVTDEFGTDLALQVVTDGHSWEITPLAFVAKRVESDEDESGFFAGLESMLLRELEKGS